MSTITHTDCGRVVILDPNVAVAAQGVPTAEDDLHWYLDWADDAERACRLRLLRVDGDAPRELDEQQCETLLAAGLIVETEGVPPCA